MLCMCDALKCRSGRAYGSDSVQDETASGAGLSHAKLAGVIAGACAAAILALGKQCHRDITYLVTAAAY